MSRTPEQEAVKIWGRRILLLVRDVCKWAVIGIQSIYFSPRGPYQHSSILHSDCNIAPRLLLGINIRMHIYTHTRTYTYRASNETMSTSFISLYTGKQYGLIWSHIHYLYGCFPICSPIYEPICISIRKMKNWSLLSQLIFTRSNFRGLVSLFISYFCKHNGTGVLHSLKGLLP